MLGTEPGSHTMTTYPGLCVPGLQLIMWECLVNVVIRKVTKNSPINNLTQSSQPGQASIKRLLYR